MWFGKHSGTMDHLISLEMYVWDGFARKQQTSGLFFDV